MFANLRQAIANAIAPQRSVIHVAHKQSVEVPVQPKHNYTPQRTEVPYAIMGELSLEQIQDLHSIRVKDAICNFAAWSCLANGFSAYMNNIGRKNRNEREYARMLKMLDHFHAWNAAMATQMDFDTVENLVARLAVVKPAKENAQTDAILARVKHMTVEEVRTQREERAAKVEAERIEHMNGYISEVWSATTTEEIPMVSAQAAHSKAIACLDWMANWNQPDIGEILIAEADIKTLLTYANRAERMEGAGEGSRQIDEQLLDAGGMAQGAGK